MKIVLSSFCYKCFDETDQTKESYNNLKDKFVDRNIEINNDNIYTLYCEKGHTTTVQFQNEKFEFLFDYGVMALIDGYSKESVSTIASSFERFIEFYIKALSINRNVDIKTFTSSWKLISKQSERQLGAFYVLQMYEFGETKFIIANKWIEFRNKVIHQGYIPSREEAIEYGDYILQLTMSILLYTRDYYNRNIFKDMIFYREINKSSDRHSIASIPTIINLQSLASIDYHCKKLHDVIESIKHNKFYTHFYSRRG
ncbi:hypothetical protein FUA48_13525 [Flavobacterium alkalisoli]|uniref:Uncharacterized protein n=1 Tax=Flavobacterium alkalisoli TaxID=2602769 RepID=A0A5B9FXB7_9FLAO|nr:hypothetical protein [Flavobacterium alkalisoli]QEE50556.1 hypothetical protein FUA48_13525 [Flavobacterium alkalisoli]